MLSHIRTLQILEMMLRRTITVSFFISYATLVIHVVGYLYCSCIPDDTYCAATHDPDVGSFFLVSIFLGEESAIQLLGSCSPESSAYILASCSTLLYCKMPNGKWQLTMLSVLHDKIHVQDIPSMPCIQYHLVQLLNHDS